MSYDILQQPTSPNVSGTELVYSVSSSNAGMPQHRYVFNVSNRFPGDPHGPVEYKFYPNQDGIGHIDLSKYANTISPFSLFFPTFVSLGGYIMRSMDVVFGEEYSLDLNTPPTYYELGELPRIDLLIGGVNNINDNPDTGYNWDSGSYVGDANSTDIDLLTDSPYVFETGTEPTYSLQTQVQYGNGMRLVYLNKAPTLMDLTVTGYDSTGSLISLDSFTLFDNVSIPSGEVVALNFQTSPISFSLTRTPNILANLDNVSYYDWTINTAGKSIRSYIVDPCEDKDRIIFVWQNTYGMTDTYAVSNPIKEQTNIDRKEYDRTFVRYEDSNSSYNISNRGARQYNTSYETTYEISTDWLDETMANYVSGLFDSPNVAVVTPSQDDATESIFNTIPIQIVNTTYETNNSTSRNKLFKYTITYKQTFQQQDR